MFFLTNICESSNLLKVFYFIIQLIKISCIIIPIGLIIMISLDFFKNIMSNSTEEMSKNTKLVYRRILYCVIIFIIPTIVNLTVRLLNKANINLVYNTCINNATIEKIKAFEAKEKAEKKDINYYTPAPKDPTSNRTVSGSGSNSDDDTNITSTGSKKILDYARKRYRKMEEDGDWSYGHGHHKTTCCIFVSNVLKDAGYLKSGYICHYGKGSTPSGANKLKNMKLYSHKRIGDLEPGDVAIYQNGHRSGNIGIFSHKQNGKYYFYQASSKGTIKAKHHPTNSTGYWKSKNGNIIIARAQK